MLGPVVPEAADELLDFWFGPLTDGMADDTHRTRWYTVDAEFDLACRRYAPLLTDLGNGHLDHWLGEPRSHLAYILLCDQLPRNVFRGSADAYGYDQLGRDAACAGVTAGLDTTLGIDERCFFYMPFEHSENLIDQHTAVGLFSHLRDRMSGKHREIAGHALRFAHQHRDIILRFSRFPHRNDVLDRESSPEEQEFVEAGDGFGQKSG